MQIKLTKSQVDIADWAVDAAPEGDDTFLRDNPDLVIDEAPNMVEPDVLYIGSTEWAGDFLYRIEEQYLDMAYDHEEGLALARIIRSSMALGKKVRVGFPDAKAM